MIATPGKQVLTLVSAECVSRFIKHKNYISDSNMGVLPRNQLPIDQLPVKINCCQVGGYKNRRISWVSYMF